MHYIQNSVLIFYLIISSHIMSQVAQYYETKLSYDFDSFRKNKLQFCEVLIHSLNLISLNRNINKYKL